jgi:hypothetical protein
LHIQLGRFDRWFVAETVPTYCFAFVLSGNDNFHVFNYSLPPGAAVFPALFLDLGDGNDFAQISAVWDHSFVTTGAGQATVLV